MASFLLLALGTLGYWLAISGLRSLAHCQGAQLVSGLGL